MAEVYCVLGRAEDLRYGVDPQPPLAPDQLVVGRVLGPDAMGNWKLLSPLRQLGERRLATARMTNNAPVDLDFRGWYVPGFGRRGHEPRSCLSGRQPVPHPVALHRVGGPGDLHGATLVRVAVDVS